MLKRKSRFVLLLNLAAAVMLLTCGLMLAGEEGPSDQEKDQTLAEEQEQAGIVLHNEIVVTATRTEKAVFHTPKPVTLLDLQKILERAPNNISELLPETPGADIVGVGANQSRPVIRGLRGQRILLMTDGIRMSNSRRTQAFGEIPSLTDITSLKRVEVVRGPSSVLYGSEAIGGVLNLITREPDYNREGFNISGNLGYRFAGSGTQHKGYAGLRGNLGSLGFMINGTYQNAQAYSAPMGSFGNISLEQDTLVNDTGVQDDSFSVFLGYRIANSNNISFKFENYQANDAGFGYIDPNIYSPGDPTIRLLYPEQKLNRMTLRFENRSLKSFLADGVNFTAYQTNNERTFDTDIAIPFSPASGMNILSSNFTDVETLGLRLELTKVLLGKHILTYGADFFQDDSTNTDSNRTEIYGFGPPMVHEDNIPKVPNATFRSFGLFVQDDISLFDRFSVILGLRYQNVFAQTEQTEGISDSHVESTDSTFVGAANFIYSLTDNLNVLLSLGRGFRSANLPERFYQGVTPDGGGYQIRNPDLEPETSFNIDLGLRFRLDNFFIEGTYFRNLVSNGIQIMETGEWLGRLPEYQNINVDKLRIQGVELAGQMTFDFGLSANANFSYLTSKNLNNPELMYADTYGSRLNMNLRYTFPKNLFYVEYHLRHNGRRKDVDLGFNPLGPVLPKFTIHSVRAGITLLKNTAFPQYVGVSVENLTNELYAEFSNASFFRPAAKRHVVFTWLFRF